MLSAVLASGGAASASPPDGGRPPRLDLDLSEAQAAAVTPQPTPAGAVLRPPRSALVEPERFVLEPNDKGGYLYRGSAFDASIAVDGSVSFSKKAISFEAPRGGPTLPGRGPFAGGGPVKVGGGPGARFDLTNEYLRKLHKDPERDAKAAFLTSTFALRMKLALEADTELRQAALDKLPVQLEQLWRDPRFTPSEREHLLHATADGFAPGPEGDAARAIVRDFARRHLSPKKASTFP